MTDSTLFTPRHAVTDERLQMHLSATDGIEHVRRGKWAAFVCDDKGQLWFAWGAPCGAGCHCDARAIHVREIDTLDANTRGEMNEALAELRDS